MTIKSLDLDRLKRELKSVYIVDFTNQMSNIQEIAAIKKGNWTKSSSDRTKLQRMILTIYVTYAMKNVFFIKIIK